MMWVIKHSDWSNEVDNVVGPGLNSVMDSPDGLGTSRTDASWAFESEIIAASPKGLPQRQIARTKM